MDEAMEHRWRELSEEVLSGMKEWRLAHPKATIRFDRRCGARASESAGSPDAARDGPVFCTDRLGRGCCWRAPRVPQLWNSPAISREKEASVAEPRRTNDHTLPQLWKLPPL